MRWTFADVCKYREYVWNKYLQYNDEDMQVINLAIGIIDACYRVAVNITIDGVVIDYAVLADLKISEHDLQTITKYRALIMSKMAALPPAILKNMQLLRTEFKNF